MLGSLSQLVRPNNSHSIIYLITITWALPYCRIPQISFPVLLGGLAFSATAADPVDLFYQQPDALIDVTASGRRTRMHGGI